MNRAARGGGGKKGGNNGTSTGAKKQQSLVSKMDNLLKKIPKGTFSGIGGAIGGRPGAFLGKGISTISGYGSYQVNSNTLTRAATHQPGSIDIPTFAPQEHGTRVRHREFITNLVVPEDPTAFTNITHRLGVDNPDLMPWLSQIASRYQKYKVKGMVFYYQSTSTDYNNSGSVAIATNYNATEKGYSSMDVFLNSMFAVTAKPSESFAAPIECDPASMPEGGYSVRHEENILPGQPTDLRLSSVGTVNIATEGLSLQPGTILGQIWCTYDVELLFPYIAEVPPSVYTYSGMINVTQNSNVSSISDKMKLPYGMTITGDPGDNVTWKLEWTDCYKYVGKEIKLNIVLGARTLATGMERLPISPSHTGITGAGASIVLGPNHSDSQTSCDYIGIKWFGVISEKTGSVQIFPNGAGSTFSVQIGLEVEIN
jgi:hypothetical protein